MGRSHGRVPGLGGRVGVTQSHAGRERRGGDDLGPRHWIIEHLPRQRRVDVPRRDAVDADAVLGPLAGGNSTATLSYALPVAEPRT